MLVSFDFDDTLLLTRPDEDEGIVEAGPNEPMLAALRAHAAAGDTVVIVTSRMARHESWLTRTSVFDFLVQQDVAGLVWAIHFTNGKSKAPTLVDLGVAKHFDDDEVELKALEGTGIQGILAPIHPAWGSTLAG